MKIYLITRLVSVCEGQGDYRTYLILRPREFYNDSKTAKDVYSAYISKESALQEVRKQDSWASEKDIIELEVQD
jgi:hypothetical protein